MEHAMAGPDYALASHPGNPIPCRLSADASAALHVGVNHRDGLVVLVLAAEDGVQLHFAPEAAQVLGTLLIGSARVLLGRLP
jgi:hypothetical protein